MLNKILQQSKKVNQNYTGPEKFNICLIVYFLTAILEVSFLRGYLALTTYLLNFKIFKLKHPSFRDAYRI